MIISEYYENVRDNIQSGDIVFIRSSSILARIITFVTLTHFSHCGIVFKANIEGRTRIFMVEALKGTRRRIVNFSFYANSPDIKIIAAPKDWEEVRDKVLERIGLVKYGWFDAFYVGIREFLNKYVGVVIPSKDFPGEICSEFVARVYGLEPTAISPGKQFISLLEAGNSIRVSIKR